LYSPALGGRNAALLEHNEVVSLDAPDARCLSLALCSAALAAVEPAAAVRAHLRREDGRLIAGERRYDLDGPRRVWLVGAGKASPAMALAVEQILGERLEAGLCIAKAGHPRRSAPPLPGLLRPPPLRRVEVLEAGHPLPDERGCAATARLLELCDGLDARDLLIVLLSGGASSLLALPAPGVELEDLRETSRLLLASGARIEEMNAVRKHLSAVTGGRLAVRAAARGAQVLALILSDVVGNPLEAIASGPCTPDPTTYADALAIVAHYRLGLPDAARAALDEGARGARAETPKPGAPAFARVQQLLCGSNELAAHAACRAAAAAGLRAEVVTTELQGEAREVGRALAGRLRALVPPAGLVLGGETTVHLGAASGRGGRNQELALAAALELEGLPPRFALCALATDGDDGPTDAAGAIVDGGTVARGQAAGLDARDHLDRHDAYPYLDATGDLLRLGPTGTNVNDLVFLISLSA
jgi:glycerate 2-kinase